LPTVAVKLLVCPVCTVAEPGATLTVTAAVIVIVALATLLPSATEVAVNVTVAGEGAAPGALYVIATPDLLVLEDNVPHVFPEQPAPVNVQFTPLFCASFCSVAVKDCVPTSACTLLAVGETATTIAGAVVTVIVAAADFVPSATEVAVSVTLAGEGTLAGAV
jgi:hypothetical protein